MTEFDTFWAAYPHRIGKFAAQKAYTKARTQATARDILDGVSRYIAHKPEWKDYCNPCTFLNQGRWFDEYAPSMAAKPAAADADWFDECRELHGGACEGDRMRHHIRTRINAEKAQAS